ncbi:MAG: cellulose synthase complex periplasmic endoglucanase BcsZ [Limnobacter sp.]|nr:cellulose synthase complex periplasmic endoglucanase BcsZ [Limnobacter sp.]
MNLKARGLIVGALMVLVLNTSCQAAREHWPEWKGYKDTFLSKDGRVVDHSTEDLRTVSEGQAYCLFFALVAADKAAFDNILTWTENNLSQGDLGQNLPAWHWAKGPAGWGVQDSNSASDADLWLAYTLLEAGRYWSEPRYTQKAKQLGNLILSQESLWVDGLGRSLLPGKIGFVNSDDSVKLNPSYAPAFVLARLAEAWADDPRWAEMYLANQQLLMSAAKEGLYPDWISFKNGLPVEDVNLTEGDFDAIRVYLWLGISPDSDPILASLKKLVKPFTESIFENQAVPLQWNPKTGEKSKDSGPQGFQWALRPLLEMLGRDEPAKRSFLKNWTLTDLSSLKSTDEWRDYGYYSGALSLFAQGAVSGKYSIRHNGRLHLKSMRETQ